MPHGVRHLHVLSYHGESDSDAPEQSRVTQIVGNHPSGAMPGRAPDRIGVEKRIVATQFNKWPSDSGDSAGERLDVLGLVSSGQTVVIELKRGVAFESTRRQFRMRR